MTLRLWFNVFAPRLLGLLVFSCPVWAPRTASAQGGAGGDLAQLRADVARLDKELREQKQLILQLMQADQQRYDMMLQLIRSMQGGTGATAGAATPAAGPPAGKLELPTPTPSAAVPGGAVASSTGSGTALVTGRVQLPASIAEAYVYVDGRGPTRARAVEIRQEGKQFNPQVLVVSVGSRVTFPNADTVFHNVFSRTPGTVFDLGTVKGGEVSPPVTLLTPGHVEIFCNIHSKMRADLLVVPNTYYTKIRPDGSFALAGVPMGSRKLVLWGPGIKPVSQVVDVRSGLAVKFTAEPSSTGPHMNKQGKAYPSYE